MSDPKFYGESEFNERVTVHGDAHFYGKIETPKIIITQEFNGIGITASNSYGTRYVSVGSTPSSNSVGNNGDIWYTV